MKSLEQIISEIKSGKTTSKEVFDNFLDKIHSEDDKIKSFNYINKHFEEKPGTLLEGIPIGVKDIFCETNVPTTCGSNMLRNFIPPYDATVIKRLNEAGMNSIGKLNMDEFAMGSSTETSAIKQTLNPHGTKRVPGGSSGGSAAAVAAGLVPASLGTDTGGSIRQPASLCGVVGFKPSYGRNPRWGVAAMASSLDCPGTFTTTVKDAGLLYEIMNGEDKMDNTTMPGKDKIDPNTWNKKDLSGTTIGVPKEYFAEGLDEGVKVEVEKGIKELKNLGAEIKEISLPMTKYAVATYYIVMPAEVSTNMNRYDGIRYGHVSEESHENLDEFYANNRSEGFGDEVKRRIVLGSYVLSSGFYDAYYKKASQVRTLIIEDFEKAFEEVDAIVSPVSPSVAWKMGEKTDDPLKMYLADSYTIPASLAGLPGISVPCGTAISEDEDKEELPVGIQILTPYKQETKLFEIAHALERKLK